MANPKGNPQYLRRDGAPGHRGGGGRPTNLVKEKCDKLIKDKKLLEWVASVAAGENVESKIEYVDNKPVKVLVPAACKDRLHAFELLADRSWGKPAQAVLLGGDADNPLPYSISVNFKQ